MVKNLTELTPYQLYNSIGQLIKEGQIFPQEKIAVFDLPQGRYFLKIANQSIAFVK